MSRLPAGTVTLMFSDIDGSTLLLSRLGPHYAEAMDAQRDLIRTATSTHGGREMGTEGDSFFVAFPTAPAAVAAAGQAQRELEAYRWPRGERVRVRMGIHTGSPTVHRGGYLGMDVHRAARIAGAAHGGQVVLSDSTAHLVSLDGLPDGAQLRDLGTHRLKDLPAPEHLFQLRLPGLQTDFGPLKSLGAASSLPVMATALVGRESLLAELTQMVSAETVRLVSLIGAGGAGKTRLAIGVAERLTDIFPDGVYFIALAAATDADTMWSTLAEVLGVAPENRSPHSLFDALGYNKALLILDNLEQVNGADLVVRDLLEQARNCTLVATSRRPLHVHGEHEFAVDPLDLPATDALSVVADAAAAQLFVQQAGSVRASFALTEANAADVAAICRRLDGLPLAIELAAARTKLLSPHALLGRLDGALDLAAVGNQGPMRQRTLRDTIDWSYRLLTPELQKLFRRLGVFVGWADLEAISALTRSDESLAAHDPFDLVAGLVDASLVTVSESTDGEPRIGILRTIRAYAVEQLALAGEEFAVRAHHARHYVGVAQNLTRLLAGSQYLSAQASFDVEIDNFRQALTWASASDVTAHDDVDPAILGLELFAALGDLWFAAGRFSEVRAWAELLIVKAASKDSPQLAHALDQLARATFLMGDAPGGHRTAQQSVEMWRRLGDRSHKLARALETLANTEAQLDRIDSATLHFTEALALARESGDPHHLFSLLITYAIFAGDSRGDYQHAYETEREALEIAIGLDSPMIIVRARQNAACSLRLLGRAREAREQLKALIPSAVALGRPLWQCQLAEDCAAVLVETGEYRLAAQLFGAAAGKRRDLNAPMTASQTSELADSLAKARVELTPAAWNDELEQGRSLGVEEALARFATAPSTPTSEFFAEDRGMSV